MENIDNVVGVTLPILDRMPPPQKVIGHVHFKDKQDMPSYPDYCLALGFNRKGVDEYIPRVFLVIDDSQYLSAIKELHKEGQDLIKRASDGSKAD